MVDLLKRLDAGLYRVEKLLCIVLLVGMSGAVFLDVVHRVAATQNPLELRLLEALGGAGVWVARGVYATVCAVMSFLALASHHRASQWPLRDRALLALGAPVALGLALKSFVALLPNGLVWSQPFALSGMLWVGFLGASIATHQRAHLTLEITEFLWKGSAKTWAGRAGAAAAAGFCGFMAWLCLRDVLFHRANYLESGGVAGLVDSLDVPRWVVYAILPWCFSVMALRFGGQVLGPPPDDTPALAPLPEGDTR